MIKRSKNITYICIYFQKNLYIIWINNGTFWTYQTKDLTWSISEASFSNPLMIFSTTTSSLNFTTTKCVNSAICHRNPPPPPNSLYVSMYIYIHTDRERYRETHEAPIHITCDTHTDTHTQKHTHIFRLNYYYYYYNYKGVTIYIVLNVLNSYSTY